MGNKRGITGRGLAWEWKNSWWILFAFLANAWIGFFVIWVRTRKKRWQIMGISFFILQFGCFVIMGATEETTTATNVAALIWMGAYLVGIALSFVEREEYLLCRDLLLRKRADEAAQLAFQETATRNYDELGIVHPMTAASDSYGHEVLDINRCTKADFATLPGVSVALAIKAGEYREKHGGFSSPDEFYSVLELKPHFVVQLEDRIKCGAYMEPSAAEKADSAQVSEETAIPPAPAVPPERRGRKLDF